MWIAQKEFFSANKPYAIRTAIEADADNLSELRLQLDGETENLDREKGEAYIDEAGFKVLIKADRESGNSLFLVAETAGKLVAFSRCAGNELKRTSHQTEFGVGVLKAFWGYGIGQRLITESIGWADAEGVIKINLKVLETNTKAIRLYEKHGFKIEGILTKDKLLSDGRYYDTVLMGRCKPN